MNKTVQAKIEEMTYENRHGYHKGMKFIRLGNYALDFKQEYVFLGFTKNGNKVILGETSIYGPDRIEYNKRFGKIEKDERSHYDSEEKTTVYRIVTDGHRYSEDIPGTEGLD